MKEKFETESNSNVLFVTEQCNNHCIMCCQPPKHTDDFDYNFVRNVRLIKTAPKDTKTVCITGGEPTLAGDKFFQIIELVRKYLPDTTIHILSNGRSFSNADFTKRLKDVGGERVFCGIPLHSDYSGDHDKIAGKKNAFNDTILGLYNLAFEGIPIEMRIVVNALNYNRLPQMAEFIYTNLFFVSWTAFMAMELTGLAVKNAEKIYAEPLDYVDKLCLAADFLSKSGVEVSFYNIPNCLIPNNFRQYATKSISDWKTKYLEICNSCSERQKCCGLFGTSQKIFRGLEAI
ncbi:MAG: His-Xaa-Ser system radical SAM maturase HxsC [Bacteroidales bacterium]|nr:His-Xaa-Ser system radical SAM maturase HxsC [Bacteroidales bacterium]